MNHIIFAMNLCYTIYSKLLCSLCHEYSLFVAHVKNAIKTSATLIAEPCVSFLSLSEINELIKH